LLATGRLGRATGSVAEGVVPALLRSIGELTDAPLRDIVFFDRNDGTMAVVAEELRRAGEAAKQPPSPSPRPSPRPSPPAEGRQQTEAAPAYSSTELLGGISPDLVEATIEIPPEDDCLEMRPYVSML